MNVLLERELFWIQVNIPHAYFQDMDRSSYININEWYV